MIFIHLGAGAGDLDSRSNFRCGFTEFIKKNSQKDDKIILVEANPRNIEKLKNSYKEYNNVKIINCIISNDNIGEKKFFYAEDDGPHYQVASTDIGHVKKYYPNSEIKFYEIKSISINHLLESFLGNDIDYLSIDLEGLDYKVLMAINFDKFNIHNISIEYLHLTKFEKKNMINHLIKKNYSYCGFGYDHNNFDYIFKKKKIFTNVILSKLIWLISTKHYKIINYFLRDKIN